MPSNNTNTNQQNPTKPQQQQPPRQDRFSAAVRSVSRGMLIGTAFGDAFGIPIETKTYDELQLLRKCWIDQVLGEHPQLAPYKHQLQKQHDHVQALEEKFHQNNQQQQQQHQDALLLMNDDQRTSSDEALRTNSDDASMKANNNRSSSFGEKRMSDDVPTPKNQDLSPPPPGPSHQSSTSILNNHSSNNTSSSANILVAPRDGGLGPLEFAPTENHPLILEPFDRGLYTDDTQLSCAMARAIAKSLGEDIDDEFVMQRTASLLMNEQQQQHGRNSNDSTTGHVSPNSNNNNNTTASTSLTSNRRTVRRARIVDEDDANADVRDPETAMMMSNNNNDEAIDLENSASFYASSNSNTTRKGSSNSSPLNLVNNTLVSSVSSTGAAGGIASSSSSLTTDSNNNNNHHLLLSTLHDDNLVCKNPGGYVASKMQFYHLAKEHVIEHQRSLAGWGGTKTAIARLIRPVEETREALARADAKISRREIMRRFSAHHDSGNQKATGNGVLMKLTPLALVLGLEQALVRRAQGMLSKEDKKVQQMNRIIAREKLIIELARMTHGSGDAIATAVVHVEMMCSLFEDFFVSCVFTKNIDGDIGSHNRKNNSNNSKTGNNNDKRNNNNNNNNNQKTSSLKTQTADEHVHQDDAVSLSCESNKNDHETNNANGGEDQEISCSSSSSSANPSASSAANPSLRGSPLFDRVQSSSKRAALVAAMFQVAIDRGISFCEELSVGDVVPNSSSSAEDDATTTTTVQNHENDDGDGNSSGDFQRVSSEEARPSSKNKTTKVQEKNQTTEDGVPSSSSSEPSSSTTGGSIIPECRFPESFAKIGNSLKKVKAFFSELVRRHQDLTEETWLQGDVFPFISKSEREQIEKTIVSISEGGTFYCVSSFIFVWAYSACFGPACAVSCARPDVVPLAIAHSSLLGGDTDSNAALIGGIFGVIFGEKSIAPHVHDLKNTDVIDEASNCLESAMGALLTGKLG